MSLRVTYAIEDELSDAVVWRCLHDLDIEPGLSLGNNGFGKLKKMAPQLNKAAKIDPFLLLTDLDENPCPSEIVNSWIKAPLEPNFIFRVAVREVEAWLLADAKNIAQFLGVSDKIIPKHTEKIVDPKMELLLLARKCRNRHRRENIIVETQSGPKQGPDYNGELSQFVYECWDINNAMKGADSLEKMIRRHRDLKERLR